MIKILRSTFVGSTTSYDTGRDAPRNILDLISIRDWPVESRSQARVPTPSRVVAAYNTPPKSPFGVPMRNASVCHSWFDWGMGDLSLSIVFADHFYCSHCLLLILV